MSRAYIGRFAPSPTGPLHLGSLAAALASHLDAKIHGGRWLLRIEDIDPPRDIAGADQLICDSLLAHGLQWDGPTTYQSTRLAYYEQAFERLNKQNLIYPCICTRRRLRPLWREYDNHCRDLDELPFTQAFAWRFNLDKAHKLYPNCRTAEPFTDRLPQNQQDTYRDDDIIIKRKDGLFAYNLAVVVDDIDSKISDIVRGDDLYTMSSRQAMLTCALGGRPSRTLHIPVLCDDKGNKLSKQHGAPGLDNGQARSNLILAAEQLKLLTADKADQMKREQSSIATLLSQLEGHWRRYLDSFEL